MNVGAEGEQVGPDHAQHRLIVKSPAQKPEEPRLETDGLVRAVGLIKSAARIAILV